MSDGLIVGIERDIVLNTLIQDKSTIMISPVVKKGVEVESMTLQHTEYKIYPQGILFFKRFLPQWKPIDDLLRSNKEVQVRLSVSFYHRGRGIFFISNLNLVQNGYALPLPVHVYKMEDKSIENSNMISASILRDGISGIYAKCIQTKGYRIFENRLWMNFPKRDFENAKSILAMVANVEEVSLQEYSSEIMHKTKLLMYLPEGHLPEKNHFPFPVSITRSNKEIISTKRLDEEISTFSHKLYIPLCESPRKDVHTIVGLQTSKKKVSPSDVMDTLLLLPICSFLSQESKKTLFSHQSNYLHILCITDSKLVLGSFSSKKSIIPPLTKTADYSFPLEEEQEYTIKLHIPVETMLRTIVATIDVHKLYTNENKATCAMCNITNVQEEDRRFLYESFTKSKLK